MTRGDLNKAHDIQKKLEEATSLAADLARTGNDRRGASTLLEYAGNYGYRDIIVDFLDDPDVRKKLEAFTLERLNTRRDALRRELAARLRALGDDKGAVVELVHARKPPE